MGSLDFPSCLCQGETTIFRSLFQTSASAFGSYHSEAQINLPGYNIINTRIRESCDYCKEKEKKGFTRYTIRGELSNCFLQSKIQVITVNNECLAITKLVTLNDDSFVDRR